VFNKSNNNPNPLSTHKYVAIFISASVEFSASIIREEDSRFLQSMEKINKKVQYPSY
jgi:hypothetical protein